MLKQLTAVLVLLFLAQTANQAKAQTVFEITADMTYVTAGTFNPAPSGGDIVKIHADRTERLKFVGLAGEPGNPIVFINSGGQVNIQTASWGALEFLDCRHIKVTGTGDEVTHFGFKLYGSDCGLAFSGFSSDVEAEFIEITGDDEVFFGIYAKKDFGGNPPLPYPQFNNLTIHDMYIHDVSEGMYIGETTSPGMEFRHVRIYNNVVTDTHREGIQIANCVEDIEIYSNVIVNAGLWGLSGQSNSLQVGGNSIAKVYNNIMKTAPDYGIINLGIGNNELTNNYIEDAKGIFIDNRYTPVSGAPISVSQNYFLSTKGYDVVRNMNEFNPLYITDNYYDTSIRFFNNVSAEPPELFVQNNLSEIIPALSFSIQNGLYVPADGIDERFVNLGPIYSGGSTEDPPESVRIVLDANNIVDLVSGGSKSSPLNLVDEQSLEPDLNEHPKSMPWIPASNPKHAPYSIELDLGQNYYLDNLFIHDLKREGDVEFYAWIENNWTLLFIDKCQNKDTWNQHELDIITSKLRITMRVSVKGEFNEIALYGYPFKDQLKSESIIESDALTAGRKSNLKFRIFPNPASEIIHIQTDRDVPEIIIYDITGKVMEQHVGNTVSTDQLVSGLYFVRVVDRKSLKSSVQRLIIRH